MVRDTFTQNHLSASSEIVDAEMNLRNKASCHMRQNTPPASARFTCSACGKWGADVRPDSNWNKQPVAMMGYR
jgi:hypothetical protein